MIRFIRFYAYPWQITRQQKVAIQQTLKARLMGLQLDHNASQKNLDDQGTLLSMMEKLTAEVAEGKIAAAGAVHAKTNLLKVDKCEHRTTCTDNPAVEIAVKVRVDKVSMTAVHPQNDSYPIF